MNAGATASAKTNIVVSPVKNKGRRTPGTFPEGRGDTGWKGRSETDGKAGGGAAKGGAPETAGGLDEAGGGAAKVGARWQPDEALGKEGPGALTGAAPSVKPVVAHRRGCRTAGGGRAGAPPPPAYKKRRPG